MAGRDRVGAFKPERPEFLKVLLDGLVDDASSLCLQLGAVRVPEALGDRVRVVKGFRKELAVGAGPCGLACSVGPDDDGECGYRLWCAHRFPGREAAGDRGVRVMGPCGGCSTMYLWSADRYTAVLPCWWHMMAPLLGVSCMRWNSSMMAWAVAGTGAAAVVAAGAGWSLSRLPARIRSRRCGGIVMECHAKVDWVRV